MNEQEAGCLGAALVFLIPVLLVVALAIGMLVGFLLVSGINLNQLLPGPP